MSNKERNHYCPKHGAYSNESGVCSKCVDEFVEAKGCISKLLSSFVISLLILFLIIGLLILYGKL